MFGGHRLTGPSGDVLVFMRLPLRVGVVGAILLPSPLPGPSFAATLQVNSLADDLSGG